MNSEKSLQGKVALVTGGAKRVGREIALALAKRGLSLPSITATRVWKPFKQSEKLKNGVGRHTLFKPIFLKERMSKKW